MTTNEELQSTNENWRPPTSNSTLSGKPKISDFTHRGGVRRRTCASPPTELDGQRTSCTEMLSSVRGRGGGRVGCGDAGQELEPGAETSGACLAEVDQQGYFRTS